MALVSPRMCVFVPSATPASAVVLIVAATYTHTAPTPLRKTHVVLVSTTQQDQTVVCVHLVSMATRRLAASVSLAPATVTPASQHLYLATAQQACATVTTRQLGQTAPRVLVGTTAAVSMEGGATRDVGSRHARCRSSKSGPTALSSTPPKCEVCSVLVIYLIRLSVFVFLPNIARTNICWCRH